MKNIKKSNLTFLFQLLEIKQNSLNDFKVNQLEEKIQIVYKNRTYYITSIKEKNILYWHLTPFKDSSYRVEAKYFNNFFLLLDLIEEDQNYINYVISQK